ncbi:hypothetical protein ACWCQZ_42745 [Streptomyces sp. NPDC002285]
MKKMARRLIRGCVTIGVATATALTLSAPAHAITDGDGFLDVAITPSGGQVVFTYDVHMVSNQYDGQGYIDNGAQVKVDCWGIHNLATPVYSKVHTKFTSQPLYATGDGVHLNGQYQTYKGGTFNESRDSSKDNLRCLATWTDGDGHVVYTNNTYVLGYF